MASAPSFPQERYYSEERRRRAMRKFSAVLWNENTARLNLGIRVGLKGGWLLPHFPFLSASVSQWYSDRNPRGNVRNEENAGNTVCNYCMLGICIISVNMFCFLFPGKERIEESLVTPPLLESNHFTVSQNYYKPYSSFQLSSEIKSVVICAAFKILKLHLIRRFVVL